MQKFDKQKDRFFEANVAKLGLLGPDFCNRIVFVYDQINAFRDLYYLLCDTETSTAHQVGLARSARLSIGDAAKAALALIAKLQNHSTRPVIYWPHR